jgi:hypothetical protein
VGVVWREKEEDGNWKRGNGGGRRRWAHPFPHDILRRHDSHLDILLRSVIFSRYSPVTSGLHVIHNPRVLCLSVEFAILKNKCFAEHHREMELLAYVGYDVITDVTTNAIYLKFNYAEFISNSLTCRVITLPLSWKSTSMLRKVPVFLFGLHLDSRDRGGITLRNVAGLLVL